MLPRFVFFSTIVLFVPLALGKETPARDWPQWRGPERTGLSTETGLLHEWPAEGPKLLWNSRTVNDKKSVGTGYSSISVADGRIFTMGDREGKCSVFALDEKTGKHLWATPISQAQGDGPRCTPTVDGDRVYALSRQGELVCLGVEKGNIIWRKSYKKDFGGHMMSGWDYSESPLVDGDKLVCTPGDDNAALVALNKYNGNLIWKAQVPKAKNQSHEGAGYASIVVAEVGGIRQYITLLGQSKGVVGVDAKTGKFLWNYNRISNGTANIPTPIVKGDLVFCSTGYGAGAALLQLVPSSDGGIQATERYFLKGNVLQNHHGGMVLIGDYVYGGHGHGNGSPFCLNIKSGEFAWKPVRGAGDGSAAVVYADGYLYFRYQNNVMALIKATPEGYRLISSFNLPGNLGTGWQHPVVVHGKLFIRGNDQILCYDVKQH
jgi:outer membrane protein assembly factor BamB